MGTRNVAPFDGLLTLDGAEVGDFVQPGDTLLKIEEAAVVEIECQLRADELAWLRDSRTAANDVGKIASPFEVPDVAVTVTYQDTTNRWTGRLTRFRGQGVDPRTRTVPCRVLVDRRRDSQTATGSSLLMRGMYVTVALPVVPKTPLIEIPTEALRPDGQVWSVSNDRLVIHRVEVVRVLRDSVLIRADSTRLTPDDHVVVSPLATTYDGMTVRVRKQVHRPAKATRGAVAMRSVVAWAIRNTPSMNTLMAGVLAVGVASMLMLQRERFPDYRPDEVVVRVVYPGASPTQTEEGLCLKIEEAIRSIVGVRKLTSLATEGRAPSRRNSNPTSTSHNGWSTRSVPRSTVSRVFPRRPSDPKCDCGSGSTR
ncbi:MAG: hypothetical protein Ct9H300mP1_11060 [Planctomycetaceae bacterium]|nr:MAG: hypothetical protein Ct9H300mP1_11060 [Planctomycetaceae bacterium]